MCSYYSQQHPCKAVQDFPPLFRTIASLTDGKMFVFQLLISLFSCLSFDVVFCVAFIEPVESSSIPQASGPSEDQAMERYIYLIIPLAVFFCEVILYNFYWLTFLLKATRGHDKNRVWLHVVVDTAESGGIFSNIKIAKLSSKPWASL